MLKSLIFHLIILMIEKNIVSLQLNKHTKYKHSSY